MRGQLVNECACLVGSTIVDTISMVKLLNDLRKKCTLKKSWIQIMYYLTWDIQKMVCLSCFFILAGVK